MSTTAAEATTTAPIANVPVTDVAAPTTTTAPIGVEDHSTTNNAAPTTTTTTTANPNVKVTPIQRINSLYNKAKLSFNEVLADAHKAVNEKNTTTTTTTTTTSTAAATETATANEASPSVPQNTHAERKVGGPNSFRDIINRVKGHNKTASSTHPVTASSEGQHTVFAATETGHVDTTTGEGAPAPPPKDNVKPAAHHTTSSGSPVVDQLKRNATLLATYILQKKKEFTENKSPENNNGQPTSTTTPEVHDETAPTTATTTGTNTTTAKPSSTPLVRRITQLVHNATANINKKRETKKTSGTPAVVTEEAVPQPAATAATEETPVVLATSTTNHTTVA